MPRDVAGNFTLVAGNPVVTLTPIATTWANPTLADIANSLTDSLDRQGRGGMLAPFKFADGTVLLPAGTFTNEPSLGFFRPVAGNFNIAGGGITIASFSAAGGLSVPTLGITAGGNIAGNGGTFSSDLSVNNAASAAIFNLLAPVGFGKIILFRDYTTGFNRWDIACEGTAESGANAGSDLAIERFSDAGGYLGAAIRINRATGIVNFQIAPTIAGVPIGGAINRGMLNDQPNATTVMADVTELTAIPLSVGVYIVEATIFCLLSATTAGLKINYAVASGAISAAGVGQWEYPSSAATPVWQTAIGGYNALGTFTSGQAASAVCRGAHQLNVTADATITLRFAANAAGTATLRRGSLLRFTKI